MTTKICKCCGKEKELAEFYRHTGMADGYLNVCKECKIAYSNKYRNLNREKIREYDRHRPNQKERYLKQKEQRENDVIKKASYLNGKYKWNAANKHKRHAHNLVESAIKTGKLVRPNKCQLCGCVTSELQAHHEDYSKPLEVIFVCTNCHGLIHRYRNAFDRMAKAG